VGQQKAAEYGQQFVTCIVAHCELHHVDMDVDPKITMRQTPVVPFAPSASAVQSFALFDEGQSVEEVAERLGRALSTTYGYLEAYIRHRRITDVTRWISPSELEQIGVVVEHAGSERLKPIHEALDGRVNYERIRIAVACLANRAPAGNT
jgi:ATP-dependent DNA helicase RecQ